MREGISMDEKRCKDCEHYIQHYAMDSRKIYRVYCGHCRIFIRGKKYPDKKACEQFVFRTTDVDGFVNKEYLSKELLKYVLSLELLPEIADLEPEEKNAKSKGAVSK